jgi:hypothetical protein
MGALSRAALPGDGNRRGARLDSHAAFNAEEPVQHARTPRIPAQQRRREDDEHHPESHCGVGSARVIGRGICHSVSECQSDTEENDRETGDRPRGIYRDRVLLEHPTQAAGARNEHSGTDEHEREPGEGEQE